MFTIEPGLYFIDSLLEPLRQGEQGKRVQLEQGGGAASPMVAFASRTTWCCMPTGVGEPDQTKGL